MQHVIAVPGRGCLTYPGTGGTDTLGLELQVTVYCHTGAGKGTQIFHKSRKCRAISLVPFVR